MKPRQYALNFAQRLRRQQRNTYLIAMSLQREAMSEPECPGVCSLRKSNCCWLTPRSASMLVNMRMRASWLGRSTCILFSSLRRSACNTIITAY